MDTANPNASADAKKVLNWLESLPNRGSNRVVCGQFAGSGEGIVNSWPHWVEDLYELTGKWPAMIGAMYYKMAETDPRQDTSVTNSYLIDHWDAGGLTTLAAFTRNPWTGGPAENSRNPGWDPSSVELADLIDPEKDVYEDWITELDYMAAGLAELRDEGVVVLWRPFHEMTFNGFWWWDYGTGTYEDRSGFVSVWQHMFDYFSDTKGLDNLLWVYAPANQHPWRDSTECYPGAGYVDIVGMSLYNDTLTTNGDPYAALLALGKLFAFGECGPKTTDGSWDNRIYANKIRSTYPQCVYWQAWGGWSGFLWAIVDNQYAQELMDDSWVITRDEVDWQEAVEAHVYKDDTNLQGLWLLEEASGTRYDYTPNDNDLTDNNGVASSSDCKEGSKSADFEGDSDQSLSITDAAQTGLDITDNLSIVAWVKPESLPGVRKAIAAKFSWTGNHRAYLFHIDGYNKVSCQLSPDGTSGNMVTAYGATTLATATWYHVAVVHNGTDIRLYVNGALDSNGANNPKTYAAGVIANTGASFRLGRTDESYVYDGLMDEVGIFNRALSALEVNDIFLNGIQDPTGIPIPVLIGHYARRRS